MLKVTILTSPVSTLSSLKTYRTSHIELNSKDYGKVHIVVLVWNRLILRNACDSVLIFCQKQTVMIGQKQKKKKRHLL